MTNSAKNKGDRGERAVQEMLRELLGIPSIRRALGAGRKDDVGDIHGVPDTVIQVADWTDLIAAARIKVAACVEQQANANAAFGATFVKRQRGKWLVLMTPEQFADLWLVAHRHATVMDQH